ncbi:MAG: hypothetical protein F7C81_04800 [Desulfurococcales archaeon]|nr:hypothetical protein [Desulfurococcales archaeon]
MSMKYRDLENGCSVIVFDVDGVLMDESGSTPRSKGLELLAEAVAGYRVYIVTGRSEAERGVIVELLRNSGIRVGDLAGILMRPRGDKSSEVALKVRLLNRVIDVEGCILELHDNNPRVLDAARKLVRGALVLHYNDGCETLKGRSVLGKCT